MDIALQMGRYAGDVVVNDSDLERDDGLETSVIISLFTDRRAAVDQIPPEFPRDDLRGWWGDVAQQYAQEALQWLIEDKVALQVTVATSYISVGWMLIEIDIYRPSVQVVRYRYGYEWTAQAAKRL